MWIHDFGFEQTDAKEPCVELVGVLNDPARWYIVRVISGFVVDARIDFVGREARDRFPLVEEIVPEFGDTARSRKASYHADDRDSVRFGVARKATNADACCALIDGVDGIGGPLSSRKIVSELLNRRILKDLHHGNLCAQCTFQFRRHANRLE